MPKRNKFSRSHYNLLTMNMGELIPIYCDEVLPGDVWQHRTSALIRVSPQVKPTMHPVKVRVHHWYVPTRLMWDDYEDFFTGGLDGDQTPEHPYVQAAAQIAEGSLFDYLGLPSGNYTTAQKVNALFVRAYNMIYNEHYRDQDLVTELTVSKESGLDEDTDTDIQKVSWEKDRLTTARLTTQRGSDISIPLSGTSDVFLKTNTDPGNIRKASDRTLVTASTNLLAYNNNLDIDLVGPGVYDPNGTLYTNLESGGSSGGVTLEDLRLAIGKQRYMEIMQRAGSRYGEYARAIFGTKLSDLRLQIPEYLGGGKQTISFSEILATADDNTTGTEVGDLKGHGIAAMRTRRYRRWFPEHGIVMTLMSVVPRAVYTQAIERQLIRDDTTVKEDYFVPQLQGIGDDEIYNREAYGFHSTQLGVFGYQNRYEEYRTKESRVAGEMMSSPGYNWHMGRQHAGDIALNQSFIECNPTKRILADTQSDSLQVMASHSIQTRRPVGRTGQPSKI